MLGRYHARVQVVHVATARIFRSRSFYGGPFSTPAGNPLQVQTDKGRLEVWFGQMPPWVTAADARVPIWAEALLSGFYNSDNAKLAELDARLAAATPRNAQEDYKWLVALILFATEEWSDEDVRDARCCWFVPARPRSLEEAHREAAASLDLAARVAAKFVPNVFSDAVSERVYVSPDDSFDRAFASLDFTGPDASVSVGGPLSTVEDAIAKGGLSNALQLAVAAPAFAMDKARQSRLANAVRTDRLPDRIGSFGRYELFRSMQVDLIFATKSRPLAVMFVDMNGLGELNKAAGHSAGDAAIDEFSKAVRECHGGDLFRTGGDEFVIFQAGDVEGLVALGLRILEAVNKRASGGIPLTASIGVVLASDPLEEPAKAVDRADQQMRRGKEESKSQKYSVRPSVLAVEGRELRLVLKQAVQFPVDPLTSAT